MRIDSNGNVGVGTTFFYRSEQLFGYRSGRGGGGEGTIVRYLQEKIGGRTPDPIPEQLQKKE